MKFIIAMLFAVMSVEAAYVSFQFDVKSSGASIYACNAGIRHKSFRDRICYDRDTMQRCNVTTQCQQSEDEDCSCVCTGTSGTIGNSGAGERLLNIMRAKTVNWQDNGQNIGTSSIVTALQREAGTNSFATLHTGANAFGRRIKELTFKLASERYGAEYFVDICYRSSQIDYDMGDDSATSASIPNYLLQRKLTVTDMTGTNDTHVWDLSAPDVVNYSSDTYQNLSGLALRSTVLCKDKDGNLHRYGSNNFQSASASSLFTFASNYLPDLDLKGCIVRYSLKEKNRRGIKSIRKWKMQTARICTETAIEDPESQE